MDIQSLCQRRLGPRAIDYWCPELGMACSTLCVHILGVFSPVFAA